MPLSTTTMLRLLILCAYSFHAVTGFAPSSYSSSFPTLKEPAHFPSSKTVDPTVRLGTSAQYGSVATKGIELAGLLYDDTGRAFDAWEWTANLGAPAGMLLFVVRFPNT